MKVIYKWLIYFTKCNTNKYIIINEKTCKNECYKCLNMRWKTTSVVSGNILYAQNILTDTILHFQPLKNSNLEYLYFDFQYSKSNLPTNSEDYAFSLLKTFWRK